MVGTLEEEENVLPTMDEEEEGEEEELHEDEGSLEHRGMKNPIVEKKREREPSPPLQEQDEDSDTMKIDIEKILEDP